MLTILLQIDSITNESFTYRQLKLKAVKYALVLKNLGVKKGDVVSVIGENSIHVAALYFGIFYLGATAQPMYCQQTPGTLENIAT